MISDGPINYGTREHRLSGHTVTWMVNCYF